MNLRALVTLLLVAPGAAFAQSPATSSTSDFALLNGDRETTGPVRLIRGDNGKATHLALGDSAVELAQVLAFQSAGVFYQTYGVNVSKSGLVDVRTYLLRRIEQGPLDLYVRVDDRPPDLASGHFDYFTTGDERPRDASVANLRAVLRDHPPSTVHLHHANRLKTAQYATFALGAAVLAYGLVRPAFQEAGNDGLPAYEFNLFQPTGLSLLLISYTLKYEKDEALREAVRAYQDQ